MQLTPGAGIEVGESRRGQLRENMLLVRMGQVVRERRASRENMQSVRVRRGKNAHRSIH